MTDPDSPSDDETAWSAGETIAVDFDGTLTQGEAAYWKGERETPRDRVVEWVNEQYYSGATVIVWTARPWSEASTIAARLTEWGVSWHGIRAEKGGSDLYVEDKSVRPEEVLPDDDN